MAERRVFHLSIPVSDLDSASRFYVQVLGARTGRRTESWLDVLLWGHQITLQLRPEEVMAPDRQGKRHFGVVLPWDAWQALASAIESKGIAFLARPAVLFRATRDEQAKFYLADPSHNVIEIKTYRDPVAVVGNGDDAYALD
jgi:extradiol dioxygenase family protein